MNSSFKLNPPSGHSDSYLDIRFEFSIDVNAEKISLLLFNDTSKETLEILGVNQGYIVGGKSAVFKNSTDVRGFINLFNDDRMNKRFGAYRKVEIKCEAKVTINGETTTVIHQIPFYNESKSLDAGIIPFDISMDNNKELNIKDGIPLSLHVISYINKSYEMCIKSDDSLTKCSFSVYTKTGRTHVEVPAEIIYSDLEFDDKKNRTKRYSMYYVKPEGLMFSRFMNRKYIPIPNSRITFRIPDSLMPFPQERKSPTGEELSDDFLLSDRYLVHTHKDFTSFENMSKMNPMRMNYLSRFFHEAQNMQQLQRTISAFSATDDSQSIEKVSKVLHQQRSKEQIKFRTIQKTVLAEREQLAAAFSNTYERRFVANSHTDLSHLKLSPHKTIGSPQEEEKVHGFSVEPTKKGCLPCSRKRRG